MPTFVHRLPTSSGNRVVGCLGGWRETKKDTKNSGLNSYVGSVTVPSKLDGIYDACLNSLHICGVDDLDQPQEVVNTSH